MKRLLIAIILCASPLLAQQEETTSTAANPLAQLKEEVQHALVAASLPFSDEQEKAITLMMEDRRKASEDLFGDLMDFRAGPTQGQDADRLNSAIEWLRNEFLGRLQDYLRPEQLTAWSRYQETQAGTRAAAAGGARNAARARAPQQTQYVRINNNSFTAEDPNYGGGGFGGGGGNGGTEVIQRGGTGAFHGNAQLLFKDSKLNSGRRFASNKPSYQENRINFDVSGPLIPGRLTTQFNGNQNEAQNADTIKATLVSGPFSRNVVKPTTDRGIGARNTIQLTDAHSLSVNFGYRTSVRKNQGIGGYALEDRASSSTGNNWNIELKQFSALSARTIFESRFNMTSNHDQTVPTTTGVKINVVDSFNSGGAQNESDTTQRDYNFGSLSTRLGERLTWKIGLDGVYHSKKSVSESNFGGTYTFSSLAQYLQGQALTYRVTRGVPEIETNQWEMGFFVQNDFKVSPRFTLMSGLRYDFQTNVPDYNNFEPRLAFAYAIGRATVIRAGGGIYGEMLPLNVVEAYHRLDGKHQYEIVIDNPSYPDPLLSGSIRTTFPSVRVIDPDLVNPFANHVMGSYERTFLSNLFISVSYDYSRVVHRARNRNLNAAMDITSTVPRSCTPGQSAATCLRPDPSRGNIINLESTGGQAQHQARFNFRQRFSIFNVSANYQFMIGHADTTAAGNLAGGGGGNGAAASGGGSDNFGFGPEVLPSDNYLMKADWSRVNQPVHMLNSTVNARLPLGVFLTETMHYDTGRTYTVTTGKDDNMDGNANDRPAGAKRNGGPAVENLNFNFNVSKAIFFGGGNASGSGGGRNGNGATQKNMNIFANITNAFNRPNYSPRSGVMTSSNFGKSTSAADPRELEVGLRFQF